MGRFYTVPFSATINAVVDAFELRPATNIPCAIEEIVITPENDETNKQLKVTLSRWTGAFTSGSGGSAVTPAKTLSGDAAASATAEVVNTTRLTGGTQELLQPEGFPSQGGFQHSPPKDRRYVVTGSQAFVVGIEENPGNLPYSGYLVFEELA